MYKCSRHGLTFFVPGCVHFVDAVEADLDMAEPRAVWSSNGLGYVLCAECNALYEQAGGGRSDGFSDEAISKLDCDPYCGRCVSDWIKRYGKALSLSRPGDAGVT